MTLVVSVLMAPAVLYLTIRYHFVCKKVLNWRSSAKLGFPVLLVSFYLFPVSAVIDFYLSGGIDVLKFPKPLTYWFWFGLVFVYQLATWVIIADLLKWAARLFSWNARAVARYHAQILIMLFLLVFGYTGWKVYHDTTAIQTDRIMVPVDGLPKALDGFKLVHISDIQGDEYTGKSEIVRYIRKVNRLNPDLIVFTGDLISYGTDFIAMSARQLGKAQSRLGTVAVVGDHDYWAGVDNVKKALDAQGIPLLQDENYILKADSTTQILLTGVTEVYSKHVEPAIVDSLTSHAPKAGLKVFASHQVKEHLIASAHQHNYDLMLAGHTHGGQLRVPFMGMTFSASERETNFISGLYHEQGSPININNGLGFTLAPIRYNAPPNISVITLVRK